MGAPNPGTIMPDPPRALRRELCDGAGAKNYVIARKEGRGTRQGAAGAMRSFGRSQNPDKNATRRLGLPVWAAPLSGSAPGMVCSHKCNVVAVPLALLLLGCAMPSVVATRLIPNGYMGTGSKSGNQPNKDCPEII